MIRARFRRLRTGAQDARGRALPMVIAALAVPTSDCQQGADGIATLGPALVLVTLVALGVPLAIAQGTTLWIALSRPRPGGSVAYGLASLWAAIAAVAGALGVNVVADLPARLRPHVGQLLFMVEVEAALIVGAWLALTYKRFAPPLAYADADAEEVPLPVSGRPVGALVAGGAALCLAALVFAFWLLFRSPVER